MALNSAFTFPVITADGQTAAASVLPWVGGRGVFTAFGTFGSGTLKLQVSHDAGTTWIDVDRSGDTFVTFTTNGQGGFELGNCLLRTSLSGATAPTITAGVAPAYQ